MQLAIDKSPARSTVNRATFDLNAEGRALLDSVENRARITYFPRQYEPAPIARPILTRE